MTGPGYDRIGTVYARHRRPDPRVAGQLGAALGEDLKRRVAALRGRNL